MRCGRTAAPRGCTTCCYVRSGRAPVAAVGGIGWSHATHATHATAITAAASRAIGTGPLPVPESPHATWSAGAPPAQDFGMVVPREQAVVLEGAQRHGQHRHCDARAWGRVPRPSSERSRAAGVLGPVVGVARNRSWAQLVAAPLLLSSSQPAEVADVGVTRTPLYSGARGLSETRCVITRRARGRLPMRRAPPSTRRACRPPRARSRCP